MSYDIQSFKNVDISNFFEPELSFFGVACLRQYIGRLCDGEYSIIQELIDFINARHFQNHQIQCYKTDHAVKFIESLERFKSKNPEHFI